MSKIELYSYEDALKAHSLAVSLIYILCELKTIDYNMRQYAISYISYMHELEAYDS